MENVILKNKKSWKLFLVLFLFGIFSLSFISSAVLSIDDANIRSNYFNFDKAWVVSMISDDYTTDSLNAYLTPQDFKDATGTKSQQALNINVVTSPNYCTYSFKTNAFNYQDVYTIEPIQLSKWIWTSSDLQELKNLVKDNCADFSKPGYKATITNLNSDGSTWTAGDYVYGSTSWGFKANIYCVKLNEKIGTIAQPIDKKIISESVWSVQADGKNIESKTISNADSGDGRSTKIGDNVWVQWQGSLVTGEDCPDVSNLIGVHDNSFYNGWIFASRDKYNTYSSYLTNGIKQDISEFASSSSPDYYKDIFKDDANRIIRDVTTQKNDFTFSVLDSSVSSGKVKINLGRNIVFPLFRLIIDADYLEISIPTGKPSVESVGNVQFTEGLSGQLTAVVKNIGTDTGGFVVRVKDCTNGFSSSTSPIGVQLTAGESRTLNFNIIGSTTSNNEEINGVCTLEMKESTTQQVSTRIFGVTLKQIQQCTPSSTACGVENGLDVIKTCNSAGTKYEITKTCDESEECSLTTSGAKCVDKNSQGDGNIFFCEDCDAYAKSLIFGKIFKSQSCEDKTFQNTFFCLFALLKILAIPFFFIISFIIGNSLLKLVDLFKDNKWVIGGLSLLIALFISFVTYLLFYVGVVLFAIFAVLKFVLGFLGAEENGK